MVDGKTVDEAVETPIHAVTKANIADTIKQTNKDCKKNASGESSEAFLERG